MWTFFSIIAGFFFLLLLPALSSLYDQEYSEQAKGRKEKEDRINEDKAAIATEKKKVEADKAWIRDQELKLTAKEKKLEEEKNHRQSYLTVKQLVVSCSMFIAIAIIIILFFKNLNSI